MEKICVSMSLTSGYQLQASSQVERAKKAIGKFLKTFCKNLPEHWPHVFPWAIKSITYSTIHFTWVQYSYYVYSVIMGGYNVLWTLLFVLWSLFIFLLVSCVQVFKLDVVPCCAHTWVPDSSSPARWQFTYVIVTMAFKGLWESINLCFMTSWCVTLSL